VLGISSSNTALKWKQIDLAGKFVTVGKSKTPNGTGRVIPLNVRIISVLEMWAAHFPKRQPNHYVFQYEKYGAKGDENIFGFTAAVAIYDSDPTQPIGDWKEAWEKARERAGAILRGESDQPKVAKPQHRRKKGETKPDKSANKETIKKPASLQCRFHDLSHSAVTRLLEAGIPYPVVANIMGWSTSTTILMAKRYGHIGHDVMRNAMEMLVEREIQVGSLKKSPKSENEEIVVVQ
jgi:integrase